MADDTKKPADPPEARRPNPPTPALKSGNPAENPRDPAANVADPAVAEQTNPGPQPFARPALRPATAGTPPVQRTGSGPLQPVVPAPSEQVFPGPVGRPDPSRTPEQQQLTAAAHIEAHSMHPGNAMLEPPVREQTSDGEPHEPGTPEPLGDDGPATSATVPSGTLGARALPVRPV